MGDHSNLSMDANDITVAFNPLSTGPRLKYITLEHDVGRLHLSIAQAETVLKLLPDALEKAKAEEFERQLTRLGRKLPEIS